MCTGACKCLSTRELCTCVRVSVFAHACAVYNLICRDVCVYCHVVMFMGVCAIVYFGILQSLVNVRTFLLR